MTCEEIRLELGAYVVGALGPTDRLRVDEHVMRCPDCRSELAELAELPALLGRLSEQEAIEGMEVDLPPTLLPDLLSRVAAERRRRRRGVLLSAAAAVLIGIAGAGFAVTQLHEHGGNERVVSAHSAAGVTTSASLRPKHEGTAVTLQISGVPAGQRCRLVAVGDDGSQQVLDEWQADYEGSAAITASAAVPPDRLRALHVLAADGHPLAELPIVGGR